MSIQLTIIGLGQIGASIGLALGQHTESIQRIGTDVDSRVMAQAKKLRAVDRTTGNLRSAVGNADVIIMALPLDQIEKVLAVIAPMVEPGAVVMDTAPVKAILAKKISDMLPDSCSYVGLTPALNPRYLHEESFGILAAKPDLFQDGLFCISTLPGVDPQAIKLAVDMVQRVGAAPLFVDLYENDGLMAAVHLLPQLMSIALLDVTLGQPGWNEARKVAGRSFAEVAGPAAHLEDAEALVSAAKFNQENITRKLDDVISALKSIRKEIADEELDELETRIKKAKAGVDRWWQERDGGSWLNVEMPNSESPPTSAEVMGGLFGFGLGKRKKKR